MTGAYTNISNTVKTKRSTCRRLICVLLAVTMLFSLSACRESPVLQQIIYTDSAPIDPDNKKNENEKDHEKEDPLLSSKKENESDKKSDFDNKLPVKGDSQTNNTANDEAYDKNGDDKSEVDANSGTSDSKEENVDDTGLEEIPNIEPTEDETVLRQIVDGKGNLVDIPENVDKVSAVGDSALYVEMLGGKNRLVASSESFTSNDMAKKTFGSAEMSKVLMLWDKKGQAAITEANFNRLVNEAKPQVCFYISGDETFTDAQLESLKNTQIYPVALPKLNTQENIKTAVHVIADVLGDKSSEGNGKKDAHSMADAYVSYLDSVKSELVSKDHVFTGTQKLDFNNDAYAGRRKYHSYDYPSNYYYTLFVSEWDTSARYEVKSAAKTETAFCGTGVAIAPSGYSTTPMNYYLSLGGVVNTAAYSQDLFELKNWYVSPLTPATRNVVITNGSGTFDRDANRELTKGESGELLGSDNFKNIIVSSADVKNKLMADALWQPASIVTSVGGTTGYGFLDSDGQIMSSNICGSYNVLVNPSGAGDWTSGSPEAPLEGFWASKIYYGDYSEDDVRSKIKDFYSRFYGYTLSSSELDKILEGV